MEDINVSRYMERKERSGFTDILLKAGEKLLDRSPGGFFVKIVKIQLLDRAEYKSTSINVMFLTLT